MADDPGNRPAREATWWRNTLGVANQSEAPTFERDIRITHIAEDFAASGLANHGPLSLIETVRAVGATQSGFVQVFCPRGCTILAISGNATRLSALPETPTGLSAVLDTTDAFPFPVPGRRPIWGSFNSDPNDIKYRTGLMTPFGVTLPTGWLPRPFSMFPGTFTLSVVSVNTILSLSLVLTTPVTRGEPGL